MTGASGFVARHLIPHFKELGHEVTGLGLNVAGPQWLAAEAYRVQDLSQSEGVEAAARETTPEAVIHLAGQSSAGLSFKEPEETYRQNLGSALGLLEGLRRSGARPRVLLVSTSEVYGPQNSPNPVHEGAPLMTISPYGASKLAAEQLGEFYGRVYGLEIVRVRPFSHTGAGQDSRFALSSFAQQIAAAERSGKPGVIRVGNLEGVRDYLDVEDVVRAYATLLGRAEPGGVYNIASGRGHRMRDLLDRMVARARVPMAVEADAARLRPQDFNFMVGDASRLRALGWEPASSVEAALDALLEEARKD